MKSSNFWMKYSRFVCLLLISCFLTTACMTVKHADTLASTNVDKNQFRGKSLAILPVKAQTALTTDSLLSLRMAINKRLDDGLKQSLPESAIVGTKSCTNTLSNAGKLDSFDEIIRTYENTGVFDRRQINTMGSLLKADYVVFSRLKAEKMAVAVLGKGFGSSLEVMIIDKRSGEVAWGGTSEYKRGGILGAGGTDNDAAAQQLVDLILAKL